MPLLSGEVTHVVTGALLTRALPCIADRLRSGKASTVSRVMADTDHVFQKNGTFSQRYVPCLIHVTPSSNPSCSLGSWLGQLEVCPASVTLHHGAFRV